MALKWGKVVLRRYGLGILVLLFSLSWAGKVWADDPTISITVKQAPPDYVASGDDINAKLQVHLIDPKTGQEVHPVGTTFAWTNPWNKKDDVVTTTGVVQLTPDTALQVEDIKGTFAAGGVYIIDVKVVAHNDNWNTKDLAIETTLTSTVVELKGIAPTDGGATQTSVSQNVTVGGTTYANNWAVVKGDGTVTIQATLIPDTDAAAVVLTWQGGDAVAGQPRQRTVSKGTSATTYVKATCGNETADLYLWVVWATITYQIDGMTPANAAQYGTADDGTEKLGAQSDAAGDKAWGKIIPIGKITPAGVHDVIKAGWAFHRKRLGRHFTDGAKSPGNANWDVVFADDTSLPEWLKLVPDQDDQIYDHDDPNIEDFGQTDSYERYDNFKQWIEFNDVECSDEPEWHWSARWKKDQTPQVTFAEVGAGLSLPFHGPNDHFYNPPAP